MNKAQSSVATEAQWRAEIGCYRGGGGRMRVLTVCGPSGAGKTTVLRGLIGGHSRYVESTEGNPFLKYLLEGKGRFDAFGNQEWFLERMAGHIRDASPQSSLVLDQDPAAIVFTYSRMFCDDGLMTEGQYGQLVRKLLEVEEMLRRWRAPRIVMCLDAPADVLRERVLRRGDRVAAPPLEWFERVRGYFVGLYSEFPGAIVVPTSELPRDQVIRRADSLLGG